MSMSHVTTHVLDTGSGKPAADVPVTLHMLDGDRWVQIAEGATDADGRIKQLGPDRLPTGTYRLAFDTGKYFAASRHRNVLPRSDPHLRRGGVGGPLPRAAPAEPVRLLHLPGQLSPPGSDVSGKIRSQVLAQPGHNALNPSSAS